MEVTPPTSNSSIPPPFPIRPAMAPSVQLGVTVLYTCLYGALFLIVYVQLWLLLFYRHKRWSYQSVFLFLCLLWAALRTTLFSFYFGDAVAANHLPTPIYWLLYCCPVCLQFFTLSLINLYFTQVLLKVRDLFTFEPRKGLVLARCVYAAMSVVFLCVNVVCASIGEREDTGRDRNKTWTLVLVRVLVNDLLFITEAVCLATLLLLLTRFSPTTSPYLNSKGTSLWRIAVSGAGVILVFLSRACYNLTVLILSKDYKVASFGFDWYNISDQADLQNDLGDMGYIVFGAILFIWELLPTSLLIVIFRVPRPPKEMNYSPVINTRAPRSYFFDDPRGMDSDDTSNTWTNGIRPNSSWFGSSETTPLLFNRADQSNQHHSLYSTPQT